MKNKWVLKKNKKSRFENSLNFTTNLVEKEQNLTWTFSIMFKSYDFKSMNTERERLKERIDDIALAMIDETKKYEIMYFEKS